MKKSSCGTKMPSAKKVTTKPTAMSGKKMYTNKTTKK